MDSLLFGDCSLNLRHLRLKVRPGVTLTNVTYIHYLICGSIDFVLLVSYIHIYVINYYYYYLLLIISA